MPHAAEPRTKAGPSAGGDRVERHASPFARFALTRALLIPAQLVFVLWLLYIAIQLPLEMTRPSGPPNLAVVLSGFGTMVANLLTGQWGVATGTLTYHGYPWFQLYAMFLPNSLQVALFALPISAALAWYLGLTVGWNRRPESDLSTRLVTLAGGLTPVFLIALLIEFAFFFAFWGTFHDIPGDGIIPSPTWFSGAYPPWITNGWVTRPTGVPVIDGLIHTDWAFEAITVSKTLMQAIVVAMVYVAIFLRHARNVVASASQEASVTAARSRGISERTLLWRHTAARVKPTFFLLFALTIPAYLAAQFVVEGVFVDPGIGYLTLTVLTAPAGDENLAGLEGMVLILAILILVWVYVVDLLAARADPRGALHR